MLELSMNILDIVENSTRAGASLIQIGITEDRKNDTLRIEITDNGEGMEADTVEKALDPFYTSKTVRRVGLGLPLLSHAAKITGGRCTIESQKGEGTTVTAVFGYRHIDRQPLGDMPATMTTMIVGNPGVDFVYRHLCDGVSYILDTREVKNELEDVPIDHPMVIQFVKENIRDGLKGIGAGSYPPPLVRSSLKEEYMDLEYTELVEEFTPEQIKELDEIIQRYKGQPGGLIPVLERAQELLGFLPVPVQKRVGRELGIPFSHVYGVVTFYSFFTMQPRGKHTVRVCLGTACYVRGGKKIAENIEKIFGIKEGDTTPDRMFTYETVRCLGACGLGPVVVVDEDIHGRVKPDKLKEILQQYN